MYRPVVLSYFAQSGDTEKDYLQFLEDEYESIAEAWEQYQIQEGSDRYFEVDFPARGSADGDKVAEDIRNYKHRLIIFHFSGHAMSQHLLFKDGASNARGLAGLLGEAQNLKLVVLNGCATYDQVKLLFDNNVKIVVATKGKVSDGVAREFAETFYKALATTTYTIRGAFEHSLNELKWKHDHFASVSTEPIVWRGLVTEAEEDRDRWELFVKEKYQQEIDRQEWWKIRLASPTRKDLAVGNSPWDKAMSFLILVLCLLGISILVYAVFFIHDYVLSFVGLAAVFSSYFGLKNQQRYKTVELNSVLADDEVIRRMKLFA
ncbi:hypothetical protein [Salmonirosea aquatica]|uniref:CHAT domain-containing protein n=1 Tax=Salmonirosea aquatica TaxID=2654236 RepID=A0A7C9BI81_9BACT|nr:hypothetical protein [Cytophagaceae bacterium SJW1-29]